MNSVMSFMKPRIRNIPLSRSEKLYQIAAHITVILVALACLLPCLYVVSISITPYASLSLEGGYTIIPRHISLEAYRTILASGEIISGFMVSILRVLVGTSIHLVVCSAAGYALSKRFLPGSRLFIKLVLFTFLFAPGLIPFYLTVRSAGLLNTFWAYVIPSAAGAWSIFVFRQFFMELPPDLEEAARLDGATELDILVRVILPLSGPVYAALGLFNAVGHWNDYMTAVIYVPNPDLQPIANVLQKVLTQQSRVMASPDLQLDPSKLSISAWEQIPSLGIQMAVVVVSLIPILLVYPVLQKHFVKGMLTGAIKG